jgi:aldehyde:ferredoxin oxidoreductase
MALMGKLGRMLFVNLAKGTIAEEPLTDELTEKYIGGYGLGAYILYTRQKAKVDPLGPGNMLGFVTGPLTGTAAITGNRYVVVGKSPKTKTWGDANSGGFFGPAMKAAGVDAVFFTGIAKKPVYLAVTDGKWELRDASKLWGKDSNETDDLLKAKCGKQSVISCIGPVGERKNLLACVMNDKGRAAGRSGLGAVMGSKRLKAIVACGTGKVPVADPKKMQEIRKRCLEVMRTQGFFDVLSKYGTSGITAGACAAGDSPIKNWAGAPEDMPNASKISDEAVKKYQTKKFGCWQCPIACGGIMNVKGGPYETREGHKPEYETLGVFGNMCLNDNIESIIRVNEICNKYGMDTISAGATVAFAIECYERGIITKKDADGLELAWGNHEAHVALTERIGKAEGIGKVLADGIKVAVERIGKAAEAAAMHVQGEELPMHDPRCNPGLGTSYQMDATPGRHTQFSSWVAEGEFPPPGFNFPKFDKYKYTGKGEIHATLSNYMHVVNSAGMCMFGALVIPHTAPAEFLSAALGKEISFDQMLETGARIAALRMGFNLREGLSNMEFKVPGRVLGIPPLTRGPLKGVTLDVKTQTAEYLKAMGWDVMTGKPTKATLVKLGLDFVAEDVA